MTSIYSIIDSAQYGLSVESVKAYVATQNIANANSHGYVAKSAHFDSLVKADLGSSGTSTLDDEISEHVVDATAKKISLDSEVVAASDAGLRYQVIADVIQKKFGLLELVYGGKK
ncbi:hypothetical protein GCM10011613_32540 [Cellvibrio zantedeschiae]|uniref:Flagellar basal body rod protein FlgB n=1 Tax=Cellvibrio zantedeschiae TaxID=1237077 RepID=A0ABQ3B9E2_9GAMM|nr:hypothetical protein [Cellvibrio zantedeschiae]GGY84952.1 hypothetical protein GCM10011613_32540 [Cellvibrio zantedeschiae]